MQVEKRGAVLTYSVLPDGPPLPDECYLPPPPPMLVLGLLSHEIFCAVICIA